VSSNDGGPQHSAGAQFADSIAAPGAADVPITGGLPTMLPAARASPRVWLRVRLALNEAAQRRGLARSKPNHGVGGAVTVFFAIRTDTKDDRCSICRLIAGGS
jgi:hypothetical protein